MEGECLKEDEIFLVYQMRADNKKLDLSLWAASRMTPNQEIHHIENEMVIHKMHKRCVSGIVKTLKRYNLKYLYTRDFEEAYKFATLLE